MFAAGSLTLRKLRSASLQKSVTDENMRRCAAYAASASSYASAGSLESANPNLSQHIMSRSSRVLRYTRRKSTRRSITRMCYITFQKALRRCTLPHLGMKGYMDLDIRKLFGDRRPLRWGNSRTGCRIFRALSVDCIARTILCTSNGSPGFVVSDRTLGSSPRLAGDVELGRRAGRSADIGLSPCLDNDVEQR